MGTSYGASKFPSLFQNCILWAPLQHSAGVSGDIDEFPIIPTGVTVTNNGTFVKDDLCNNKSVLKFDGSTNYVSLTDNDAWAFGSGNFTIGLWIKIPSTMVSRFIFWNQTDAANFHDLSITSLNSIKWQLGISASYVWNIATANNSIPIGEWCYITLIRTGSSQIMYVNGNASGSTGNSATAIPNFTGPFYIGYEPNGYGTPSSHWYGNIKDLMIFTRALSLPEIKLLMNRTNPVTGEGLIDTGKYWRLTA